MIPGEIIVDDGDIQLNTGRVTVSLLVANHGAHVIYISSHFHFNKLSPDLVFDREKAKDHRLNIAAGTMVEMAPGQQRTLELIPYISSSI